MESVTFNQIPRNLFAQELKETLFAAMAIVSPFHLALWLGVALWVSTEAKGHLGLRGSSGG